MNFVHSVTRVINVTGMIRLTSRNYQGVSIMEHVKKEEITTNWFVILLTTDRARADEERIMFNNLVDCNRSHNDGSSNVSAGSNGKET